MSLADLFERLADLQVTSGMDCERAGGCDASCCWPSLAGGEPSVTAAEIGAINRHLAARGAFAFHAAGAGACKFLGADGRCGIYAVRPIDCRVHFCAGGSLASREDPAAAALVDAYHARREAGFMASERLDAVRFHGEPSWS